MSSGGRPYHYTSCVLLLAPQQELSAQAGRTSCVRPPRIEYVERGAQNSVLRAQNEELGRITGFDIMPPSDTHANAAVTTRPIVSPRLLGPGR